MVHRTEGLDREAFRAILEIIAEHSLLVFGDKEQSGLLSKIQRRVLALELSGIEDYRRYLLSHRSTELPELIALATTHHTAFFREFVHFQELEGHLLKRAFESSGRRRIRVWSAAASRGHEAYSLAMFFESLQTSLGPFDYEILATDIDEQSLQVARNGVYPAKEVNQSPALYLGSHWSRGTSGLEGWMKARDSLRRKIRFSQVNLLKLAPGEPGGRFDFIFCRNVFLYFTKPQIDQTTRHLLSNLEEWGALFLGVCENLMDVDIPLEARGHSIFQPRAKGGLSKSQHAGVSSKPTGRAHSADVPRKVTEALPQESQPAATRVLVVDDSPTILALMKKLLTPDQGFEVVAAVRTLSEARAAVARDGKGIDLMTLDLHLDGETGLDYLVSLNPAEKQAHPPIVIVSALGRESEDLAKRALEKGAVDYVEKPDLSRLGEMAEELRSKLKIAARSRTRTAAKRSNVGVTSSVRHLKSKSVSVLVVDDSPTMTRVLEKMIRSAKAVDGTSFEVLGCVTDPRQIEAALRKRRPDVMTLDMNMPGLTGVDVLRTLPENLRVPTLVVSALGLEQGSLVLEALALGAVDYFAKPSLTEIEAQSAILAEKIVMASRARLVPRNLRPRGSQQQKTTSRMTGSSTSQLDNRIVGIGASTGGTEAIRVLLSGLPLDMPPICIVQHIPPSFSAAFAKRLAEVCQRPVEEVRDGQALERGVTYVAPGDRHFLVENRGGRLFAQLNSEALRGGHRPSVDVLFESLAELRGIDVSAALLTGMGKDGAEGLLRLREKGSLTVCQSESTCVVFGMPRAAIERGAALYTEDLDAIPDRLIEGLGLAMERRKLG